MATIPTVPLNSPFRLNLDTSTNLSGATSPTIYWKKQNGDTGSQSGTIDGTIIYTDFAGATIDTQGVMHFQAAITFSGDTAETRGRTAIINVLPNFTSP